MEQISTEVYLSIQLSLSKIDICGNIEPLTESEVEGFFKSLMLCEKEFAEKCNNQFSTAALHISPGKIDCYARDNSQFQDLCKDKLKVIDFIRGYVKQKAKMPFDAHKFQLNIGFQFSTVFIGRRERKLEEHETLLPESAMGSSGMGNVKSSANAGFVASVESSNSGRTQSVSTDVSRNMKHDDKGFSKVRFWLFVPDKYGTVEMAWLIADCDYLEMIRSTKNKMIWTSEKFIQLESSYHFAVKTSGFQGLRSLVSSLFTDGASTEEETQDRRILERVTQRDIFGQVRDTQKGIYGQVREVPVILEGYKVLLETLLDEIETECDFWNAIDDFEKKHVEYIKACNEVHLIQHVLKVVSPKPCINSTGRKTLFVVYILSKICLSANDLMKSPALKFPNCDKLKLILEAASKSEVKLVGTGIEENMAEILMALVKMGFGSHNSWAHFVLYYFQILSTASLIKRMEKFDSYNEPVWRDAVQVLSNSSDDIENCDKLLVQIVCSSKNLEAVLEVTKTVKERFCREEKHMKRVKDRVLHLVKDNKNVTSLTYICELVEKLDSVDQSLSPQLSETFEEHILNLMNSKQFDKEKALKLVFNKSLFGQKRSAMKILFKVANSEAISIRSLLPTIAKEKRFMDILNSESNLYMDIVRSWLSSAKKIRPECGYDQEWYKHIRIVLEVISCRHDKSLSHKSECLINEYFISSAKKYISKSDHDIADLVRWLRPKIRNAVGENVLYGITEDLEHSVLKLVQASLSFSEPENVSDLFLILTSDILFNQSETGKKILEAIAKSKVEAMHGALLKTVSVEKFWEILQTKDFSDIFRQWITTAKACHCKAKAKQNKHESIKIATVLYMYEYLARLKSSVPSRCHGLLDEIEANIKAECGHLSVDERMKLSALASELTPEANNFLENHFDCLESKTLSYQELETWISRFVESGKLDFETSSKLMSSKMFGKFLDHLYERLEQPLTSHIEKRHFTFRHYRFWLILLSFEKSQQKKLRSHEVVNFMKSTVNNFAKVVLSSTISVKEFQHAEKYFNDAVPLIEAVAGCHSFRGHWEKLRKDYDDAIYKHSLLNMLHLSLLQKITPTHLTTDLKRIQKDLECIRTKLEPNSSLPVEELTKSSFFLSLNDLMKPAEKLDPLKNFKSFVNLCREEMSYLDKDDYQMLKESRNEAIAPKFGEELTCLEISATQIAYYLQDKCIELFESWLRDITQDSATLHSAIRYGTEQISKEVKAASEHFGITVSQNVIIALDWLDSLKANQLKVENIGKTLHILNLASSLTDIGGAFSDFNECICRPEMCTMDRLANTMNQMKEVLSDTDEDFWVVFEELPKATELVCFIRETLEDDFRNLIDAVEEQSEQTIDESTVSDLIRVKQFLQPLLTQSFPAPKSVFESIRKSMEKKGKDISKRINNCAHHVHGLKALYQHVANRGELTKEIISSAMERGFYKWRLEADESCCKVELTYRHKIEKDTIGTNSDFRYGSEELGDLRSRALLLFNSEKEEKEYKEKHLKEVLQDFVRAVDKVLEITATVTELHQLGHFSYRNYSHEMQSDQSFLENLIVVLNGLNQKLEEWTSVLDHCRQDYKSLNFLYSDQLSLVYNFLCGIREQKSSQQIQNLLQFVRPGSTVENLKEHLKFETGKHNMSDQEALCLIGSVLDKVIIGNSVRHTPFPQTEKFSTQSKDVNAIVERGILYIAHLDVKSAKTIPTLLSLYANTKCHFPIPSEVLFCHELSSWEEIQLLINRSVQTSELHCICNVEKLSSNLQTLLVEALGKLLETANNNYCLAVICRGGEHHSIIDYFSSHVHRLSGFDTATLQACLQDTWPEIIMVTSDVPGLGKTEYIRNLAEGKGKRMKTVHISGPLSREILVSHLQGKRLAQCDLLHIDIGEVDDPNFLDAFLFELIVAGCVYSGTRIVSLPTAFVAIEVANTTQDHLRDSFIILSSFKRKHLILEDYQNFAISTEICSPVQIVCNYLQLFDEFKLDRQDVMLAGPNSVKPLPPEKCKLLLSKYFCSAADLSYSVMEIFLNVLGDQLRKMSNSQFFRVKNLTGMLAKDTSDKVDVRSQMVKALIDVAKEFACRSVHSCRPIQNATLLGTDSNQASETKQKMSAPKLTLCESMVKRTEGMLQWADTNHLLLTFNGIDSQTVSALYRDLTQVPDYIKELFRTQLRKELPDFSNLSQEELLRILERVARSEEKQTKDLDKSYALTPDNILKMVLVLLRIRAKIPVVIMGETGCGKTSLIRFLAHVCDTEFKRFSIHAGITAEDIESTVLECNIQCHRNTSSTVWLFFDEINTCDHLGLLTEIICHHSCFGKRLSKNLVLIAACNPYRLRDEHQILTAGLKGKVKTDSFSRLVYRVHLLPETMMDYVWDYGTLHHDDEKAYIKQMVIEVFPEAKSEWKLQKKIIQLLVTSQNFMRKAENSDWCVSLRDVSRCQMLMTKILKMLQKKLEHILNKKSPPTYVEKCDDSIYICSIVLALAHCYQSRLATTSKRDEYWKQCSQILLESSDRFTELTNMLRYEQLDLLNRMELPHGIAKNTALCENVFVILICILNRIPIFVVGKPGCSKSLSVQLIKSNLRGKDSVDSYFQTLPNLYVVAYQGSESSTSEGILKVFKKAEKYGKANKEHDVLPVVLLDEVGLAEASRFNPLKVLHELLEPDTGKVPTVSVVGISNWSLDAAKMNRAIHLSRPDLDREELFETAKSISTIHPTNIAGTSCDEEILRALAEAYFKYQEKQLVKNFHGLRDYYSLIKYVSRIIKDDSIFYISEIAISQMGLQRNFGGTECGVAEIVKYFSAMMDSSEIFKWPIQEIIMGNLTDKLARHLLLITSGDSSLGVLLNCLKSLNRNYTIIFGSKFEEDQSEGYSYRMLSRIILCTETGNVLILKDLDAIYGSLYDMLNQNYTIVGKKKNCRIALGPFINPMCQVHDDFRCIVLVDEHKISYSDPPFLNRFEKQILRFEDIIGSEEKRIIKDVENWMDDCCKTPTLPFLKENAFIGVSADIVPSLVYLFRQQYGTSDDKIFEDCQKALLWLVPPDAILRLTHSEFGYKSTKEMKDVQCRFFERPVHDGLSKFLFAVLERNHKDLPPVFEKTPAMRLVVYTHSNVYVDVRRSLKQHESLQVEKLGNFKSEKQLTQQFRCFFESNKKLLILQCEPREDGKHIPLAKFQLEELHQEYGKKTEKHICIILHVERGTDASALCPGQFSLLSGWQIAVIDSLEGQEEFPLSKILRSNISDILQTEFCPIKKCIQKNLVWAFTCTNSSLGERSVQEFSDLITSISKSDGMLTCLAKCILEHIKSQEKDMNSSDFCDPDRWQVKVACDMRLLHSATTFTDALRQYLTRCVTVPLANLVYNLEKLSAWHSYFRNEERSADMWKSMFQNQEIFHINTMEMPHGPGTFKISHKPLNLQFPFSKVFISKLGKREELFKEDLSEAELTCGSDDLSVYENNALLEKYQGLFDTDLSMLGETGLLQSMEQEMMNDICNCLSLGYVLDENDRIEIGLWLHKVKNQTYINGTPLAHISQCLLDLWRYAPLFHALLQLISECHAILPCSVKEMLLKTCTVNEIKDDTEANAADAVFRSNTTEGHDIHSREEFIKKPVFQNPSDSQLNYSFACQKEVVTKVGHLHASDETQNEELTDKGSRAVDISAEYHMTADVNNSDMKMKLCDLHEDESKRDDRLVDTIDMPKNEKEVSFEDDSKDEEESDLIIREDSNQNDKKKEGNETLNLRPEDHLVHLFCKLLIPNKKVIEESGRSSSWHGKVCSMLSFCGSVSNYPVSFHALRIFNDFATVLFHCNLADSKIKRFLLKLSEVIDTENLENSLISETMFETILQLYGSQNDGLVFEGVSKIDFQCFLCMYIGRTIDIDPEIELFGQFLMKAAILELPDEGLSHLGLLLHRVLLELATSEETLIMLFEKLIIDSDGVLEEFTQLQAMDQALAEVDIKQPQFLILCVDVIQDTVMKTKAWKILDGVKSASHDVLLTLKMALELVRKLADKVSLRTAAALAFVKEFLDHMAEIVAYDFKNQCLSDHVTLYQNMNALLSIEEGSRYMLRRLKLKQSFETVKKVVVYMEKEMPILARNCSLPEDDLSLILGYKVLGKSTTRNTELESLLLRNEKTRSDEYLNKSVGAKELLSLIEALLHTVYLPNAIRPLTDTEKQIGEWIRGNVTKIPHQLVRDLLLRITSVESFGSSLFRMTTEMNFCHLQQASFLLHLISVLVVKISFGHTSLFTECLNHPDAVFKVNLHSLLTKDFLTKPGSNDVICFSLTCKCWSRVMFSENCEQCPVCDSKWANAGVHIETFYANDFLPTTDVCCDKMTLALAVLELLVEGSMLCSLALGTADYDAIKAVIQVSDLDNFFEERFKKTWNLLEESLQLNHEEMSLFLHSIVDDIDSFAGNIDFHNYDALQQQISISQSYIINSLKTSLYPDLKLYYRAVSVTASEIQQSILELPVQTEGKLPKCLSSVFRVVGKRTLSNMKFHFYMNEKEKHHPVVDMFFRKGKQLTLLIHLMPLMKWAQLTSQTLNHRFSREEFKTLTVNKLAIAFPELKESLMNSYEKCRVSLEDLCSDENISVLRKFDSSLNVQRPLDRFMVCDSYDSLIFKMLKALVHIQNMFLSELLVISKSGKCPSLGFLKKNSLNVAAIKSVLLQALKEDQVIICDFDNTEIELTRFAQNDLLFGFGNQVCYNFFKIEMELANMLCLGKAYVIINQTFPLVTYANEMFVTCGSMLRDLKMIIPQKPLGQSIKCGIEEKQKSNRDFVNDMMRHTEILLCLAKKTGGNPEQNLRMYNQAWLKTLPGGFTEDNLVFEGEPLCLTHLVALYEFLENILADAAVKSMNFNFRKPLPTIAEKELKDFANAKFITLSSIQTAFRRFIIRYLVNFDPEKINVDAPLIQWMTEPSLWPEGVHENGELDANKEGCKPGTIKSEFPNLLNLEHTFCALLLIDDMIEDQRKHRVRWLPEERKHVTGSATSGLAKPQQGRQRAKVRIGKT